MECEVTGTGGPSARGSFKVIVEDTTPPGFTNLPDDRILIALNIIGALLDIVALEITAEDVGNVSDTEFG